MLATSARMVPDIASAWFELPSALHRSWSPFLSMATLGSAGREITPSGPLTEIWPEATFTSTPFGTAIGYLAIRDTRFSFRHDAKHFAAHAIGASLAVGHHAARGGQDRHPQAVHDLRNIVASLVDAQPGLGDALEALNYRLAGVVLEADAQLFF